MWLRSTDFAAIVNSTCIFRETLTAAKPTAEENLKASKKRNMKPIFSILLSASFPTNRSNSSTPMNMSLTDFIKPTIL